VRRGIQTSDGEPPSLCRRVRGSGEPCGRVAGRALAGGCCASAADRAWSVGASGARYVNAALERPEGLAVPERTAVFTVRLAPSLIAGLRRHARSRGQTLSATVTEAVRAYLDQAHERHGGTAR